MPAIPIIKEMEESGSVTTANMPMTGEGFAAS